MQNSIVRHFGIFAATWTNFENISWFLISPVHDLPRNTAKTKFLNVKLVLLSDTYLIIIFAICHCHPFKNGLVLVLNTAWRKQPIADDVSNHNRTCGKSVSENSE